MRRGVMGVCAAAAALAAAGAVRAADYGALFEATWKTVADNYYDPTFGGRDWTSIGARYRAQMAGVRDDASFRKVAGAMLGELKVSHLHISPPSTSPSSGAGIGVEWGEVEGRRTALSVSPLSDAWRQGVRPGYLLIGDENALRGPVGSVAKATVQGCDGRSRTLNIRRERTSWPPPGPAFYWSTIETNPGARFGYLRVDRFDDGADKLADQAMEALGKTRGLIIDLRGNSGGNVTALRLASYFTPGGEQPAVGLFAQPYLKRLGRPVSKADVANGPKIVGAYTDGGVFKAVSDNGGIAVFYTEDLGAKRYAGPVAVLIGADTGSAAEGFAWTMKLKSTARLIGRPTAGALLSGETFDLPDGWKLTVPVQGLWGPDGQDFADRAVPPHETVALGRADLCSGRDHDLERAMQAVGAR